MDVASYTVSHIRQMLGDSHPTVQSAQFRMLSFSSSKSLSPTNDRREEDLDLQQVDEAVTATYKSATTGAEGRIVADARTAGGWPLLPASWSHNLPSMGWPKCVAELEEKQVEGNNQDGVSGSTKLGKGERHVVQRTVTYYNPIAPSLYHSIVVEDKHSIKSETQTVRSWVKRKTVKSYDWPDKSDGRQGADWWVTYRYQLEEFVNRVKGRKGSGVWFSCKDSIDQMAVLDEMYEKGGLKPRPSAKFDADH